MPHRPAVRVHAAPPPNRPLLHRRADSASVPGESHPSSGAAYILILPFSGLADTSVEPGSIGRLGVATRRPRGQPGNHAQRLAGMAPPGGAARSGYACRRDATQLPACKICHRGHEGEHRCPRRSSAAVVKAVEGRCGQRSGLSTARAARRQDSAAVDRPGWPRWDAMDDQPWLGRTPRNPMIGVGPVSIRLIIHEVVGSNLTPLACGSPPLPSGAG